MDTKKIIIISTFLMIITIIISTLLIIWTINKNFQDLFKKPIRVNPVIVGSLSNIESTQYYISK